MSSVAMPQTSPTLLGRLSQLPPDQEAWADFVECYGRKIYGWCRHWGLQQADAEDVTQEVLTRLTDKMHTFRCDPSGCFRGWLKTLTHHAWYDFLVRRSRCGGGSGDTQVLLQLETLEAREDLMQRLAAEFGCELLQEAEARVRLRVCPRHWEAFRLLALEGWSGVQAARHL